jgi:predicted nucleic acid-binding protein
MSTARRPRRLWDSVIVLGYLAGYEDLKPDCPQIIQQARQGELEIMVSEMAKVEAAYLEGRSDIESEALISEFFSRDYIIPVSVDDQVSKIARGLIRKYRNSLRIKPPDAVHLATAILWHIPVIETTDPDLLRLDGREGNPPIRIRRPRYEGQTRFI